jgi:GGDEF domain-containing protein
VTLWIAPQARRLAHAIAHDPVAVAFVDVDDVRLKNCAGAGDFRAVDAILDELLAVALSAMDGLGTADRFGDEYVLMMPRADVTSVCAVIDQMRSYLLGHEMTLSAGIAVGPAGPEILAAAEARTVRAKLGGKDRVEIA